MLAGRTNGSNAQVYWRVAGAMVMVSSAPIVFLQFYITFFIKMNFCDFIKVNFMCGAIFTGNF
jgi:hypothetical protein